jgi:hypothetical protein
MMDILVDDIDRYEQLSNREELLALVSALAGNGAVLEVVPAPSSFDVSTLSGSTDCVYELPVCLRHHQDQYDQAWAPPQVLLHFQLEH